MQHLVGHAEGFGKGGALIGDAEQVLVRDDDQRIDIALQLGNPGIGQTHAVTALEGEGLGDHTDRQDATFPGALGDDRRRTCAGAAAHAGGDEHHMRAIEVLGDQIGRFLSRGHPHFRVCAGAQAHGDTDTELNALIGTRKLQLLRVRIGHNKLDAFQSGLDHVVDGITPGAAHPEHHNSRL